MAETSVKQVQRLIPLDARVKHGPVGTPGKERRICIGADFKFQQFNLMRRLDQVFGTIHDPSLHT